MERSDTELGRLADGTLMVLFANGDPDAARVLTDRLLPRAYRHAARVLGNAAEAEDVAQEALLRLWRAARTWQADGAAKPSTWLHKVVANLAIDRLRRSGRSVELGEDDFADPSPGAEARLQEAGRRDALDAALASLPERQRQAVILRHIEGLSNPEIAEILDVGVEAVESLTARGKRALKAALAGQKEALGYGHG
ncbi:RNA polymerase sigma factor [Gymnodinialimonas sp. 2305UL16-5]|uniref:RNA polymerase sigma factor n=1 Tax=Gymnodinialimonas mytili TaxID=3126503 RepID=UPI0030A0C44F